MSTVAENQYDLVIYGATGFTGQFVVEEVAKATFLEKKKNRFSNSLKWAVAGRSKDKLLSVLDSSGNNIGDDLDNVAVLEADTKDYDSLLNLAYQAKVVINCVGPYYIHGENVVKACIEKRANYVDISGEPQFIENMQLKYDKQAKEAGVHIISACGYDSIPADVGLCYMIKNFSGVVNSAECFVSTRGGGKAGIHTGTMESAALAIANKKEVEEIRKQLYPNKLSKPKYKIESRGFMHNNSEVGGWGLRLPTDEPVVYHSQRYFAEEMGKHPVQFRGYITFRSFFHTFSVLLGALYFMFVCSFSLTRNLLFKFPEAMTAGVFSRAGPSREQLKSMTFTSTIIGKGWEQKLTESSVEYATPPDSKIIVKVCGMDPGYGATALMLVASAMTILLEKSSCEAVGGVMTPGVAFMNTKIVDRMTERGMKFTHSVEKL